jgi:hypothetical protein
MNIKAQLTTLADKLLYSVRLYPLASIFAFIFTFTSIYGISEHTKDYFNVLYASSFGFFLIVAVYFWKRNKFTLIGALALVAVYFLSLPTTKWHNIVIDWQHFALIASSLLLLVVLPFLKKQDANLKFWAWSLNAITSLLIAALFGLVLYAGFAGAMKAVSVLFAFRIEGKYYEYLFTLIIGLFSTHYFLSSLFKEPAQINVSQDFYGKVGTFFAKYILTSIAILYALILCGYALKIAVMVEWPKGVLVWLS